VRTLRAAGAIVVALTLQTTLSQTLLVNRGAFDLVLIVVIYLALVGGPTAGLLIGSAAGLLQDALAGGILGIGGLAKSVVGYASGFVGTQFILTGALPRFLVFALGSMAHAGVVLGLYRVIDPRVVLPPFETVLSQAGLNAVIGVLAFLVVEQAPGWWQRRRLRRSGFGRRWRA